MFKTPQSDTLGMSETEMRALGHAMVDMVVDHLAGRNSEPAIEITTRKSLEAIVGGPVPEQPSDAGAAIELLRSQVLNKIQHADHPRYFARVASPASFTGILGDWLAAGFNAISSSWIGSSGTATLELIVLDWLRSLMGFPTGTQGVILSGGSMANFTGFAAAFAVKGRGAVYLNDQTHSSLKRNLVAAGLAPEQIRVLPTNSHQIFDMALLANAIAEDKAAGRKPVMVIANAGTTNTGAIDPLPGIADLCRKFDLWMHVDGAYGAPAALTEQGRKLLAGLERADSLVLDPHKWMFQPYDCGCLLVRHAGALERAFAMHPEYLKDVMAGEDEVDFFNRSLELSRKSRAIKLWLTFKTHGRQKIAEAVAAGILLAEEAERQIRADSTHWQLVTPAQIGIVTFVRRGATARQHASLVNRITETGYATLSSTEIAGESVLRLCTLNPMTTADDISGTLQRLAAYPLED